MKTNRPSEEYLTELLYQALETEQGGIKIYEQAVKAAVNDDLRNEWARHLKETRRHERILLGVFEAMGLDPMVRTTGRDIAGGIGDALVKAIAKARASVTPAQAELVASECVVLAEYHASWELLAYVAEYAQHPFIEVLQRAVDEVKHQEDRHRYHTRDWRRELWIQSLGLPAALPPPEDIKQADTPIGASRAEQAREYYI